MLSEKAKHKKSSLKQPKPGDRETPTKQERKKSVTHKDENEEQKVPQDSHEGQDEQAQERKRGRNHSHKESSKPKTSPHGRGHQPTLINYRFDVENKSQQKDPNLFETLEQKQRRILSEPRSRDKQESRYHSDLDASSNSSAMLSRAKHNYDIDQAMHEELGASNKKYEEYENQGFFDQRQTLPYQTQLKLCSLTLQDLHQRLEIKALKIDLIDCPFDVPDIIVAGYYHDLENGTQGMCNFSFNQLILYRKEPAQTLLNMISLHYLDVLFEFKLEFELMHKNYATVDDWNYTFSPPILNLKKDAFKVIPKQDLPKTPELDVCHFERGFKCIDEQLKLYYNSQGFFRGENDYTQQFARTCEDAYFVYPQLIKQCLKQELGLKGDTQKVSLYNIDRIWKGYKMMRNLVTKPKTVTNLMSIQNQLIQFNAFINHEMSFQLLALQTGMTVDYYQKQAKHFVPLNLSTLTDTIFINDFQFVKFIDVGSRFENVEILTVAFMLLIRVSEASIRQNCRQSHENFKKAKNASILLRGLLEESINERCLVIKCYRSENEKESYETFSVLKFMNYGDNQLAFIANHYNKNPDIINETLLKTEEYKIETMAETIFRNRDTIKYIEVYNVVYSPLDDPPNIDQVFRRQMVKVIYWAYGLKEGNERHKSFVTTSEAQTRLDLVKKRIYESTHYPASRKPIHEPAIQFEEDDSTGNKGSTEAASQESEDNNKLHRKADKKIGDIPYKGKLMTLDAFMKAHYDELYEEINPLLEDPKKLSYDQLKEYYSYGVKITKRFNKDLVANAEQLNKAKYDYRKIIQQIAKLEKQRPTQSLERQAQMLKQMKADAKQSKDVCRAETSNMKEILPILRESLMFFDEEIKLRRALNPDIDDDDEKQRESSTLYHMLIPGYNPPKVKVSKKSRWSKKEQDNGSQEEDSESNESCQEEGNGQGYEEQEEEVVRKGKHQKGQGHYKSQIGIQESQKDDLQAQKENSQFDSQSNNSAAGDTPANEMLHDAAQGFNSGVIFSIGSKSVNMKEFQPIQQQPQPNIYQHFRYTDKAQQQIFPQSQFNPSEKPMSEQQKQQFEKLQAMLKAKYSNTMLKSEQQVVAIEDISQQDQRQKEQFEQALEQLINNQSNPALDQENIDNEANEPSNSINKELENQTPAKGGEKVIEAQNNDDDVEMQQETEQLIKKGDQLNSNQREIEQSTNEENSEGASKQISPKKSKITPNKDNLLPRKRPMPESTVEEDKNQQDASKPSKEAKKDQEPEIMKFNYLEPVIGCVNGKYTLKGQFAVGDFAIRVLTNRVYKCIDVEDGDDDFEYKFQPVTESEFKRHTHHLSIARVQSQLHNKPAWLAYIKEQWIKIPAGEETPLPTLEEFEYKSRK